MSFDSYWEKQTSYTERYKQSSEAAYKAGATSRQAEVDELQKRIDKLKSTAEWHIEDCACSHPISKYQLGWFEAMSLVLEVLKGEESE